MPVVVSMLNSYSGWATAASGFMLEVRTQTPYAALKRYHITRSRFPSFVVCLLPLLLLPSSSSFPLLQSNLLIITGSLVGSSGAILSYIMCRAMNRSFVNVILGGLSASTDFVSQRTADMQETANIAKVDGVVLLMKAAKSIIIVPGYGMAVARCQTDLAQVVQLLRTAGKQVRFCIHPVAGRLPGHRYTAAPPTRQRSHHLSPPASIAPPAPSGCTSYTPACACCCI